MHPIILKLTIWKPTHKLYEHPSKFRRIRKCIFNTCKALAIEGFKAGLDVTRAVQDIGTTMPSQNGGACIRGVAAGGGGAGRQIASANHSVFHEANEKTPGVATLHLEQTRSMPSSDRRRANHRRGQQLAGKLYQRTSVAEILQQRGNESRRTVGTRGGTVRYEKGCEKKESGGSRGNPRGCISV